MPKRQAEDSLEDFIASNSPAPKKLRIEDVADETSLSDRSRTSEPAIRTKLNGNTMTPQLQNGDDAIVSEIRDGFSDQQNAQIDSDEEGEELSASVATKRQSAPTEGYSDLYLDTIDRSVLDFDFEKLCSVTLSNVNVYACLVCGKYFQGRGEKTHAYFHALEVSHHVFINMASRRVYVLPEGYEVKSQSLDDIKFVVDPTYTKEEAGKLDRVGRTAWDLGGKKYIPGFIGMNNIKENDYFNVVIQALAHVPPLRNFFMLEDLHRSPELVHRFSILVRKIWNPRAFKSHVSPHELLQEVSQRSSKKFTLSVQSDPVDFLSWFLNNLHLALGGSKTKPGSSIIQKIFQGKLKVESQQITAKADAGDRLRFEEAAELKTDISRFLLLTLDLPAAPLFQDEVDKNIIPQVALTTILSKYDGLSPQEHLAHRRRYRLLHPLPPYLMFHIKRFSTNKFVSERNPTIVTFPVRSLDMSPYVEPNPSIHPPGEPIWYDLVANITHEAIRSRDDSVEGEQARKLWRVQLRDKSREEWIQVQDLFIEDIQKDLVFTQESYLQIWERRREAKKNG